MHIIGDGKLHHQAVTWALTIALEVQSALWPSAFEAGAVLGRSAAAASGATASGSASCIIGVSVSDTMAALMSSKKLASRVHHCAVGWPESSSCPRWLQCAQVLYHSIMTKAMHVS